MAKIITLMVMTSPSQLLVIAITIFFSEVACEGSNVMNVSAAAVRVLTTPAVASIVTAVVTTCNTQALYLFVFLLLIFLSLSYI